MRFGTMLTAGLAALVMVGGLATSAHAAQQSSTPTGHDASYPQCGARLPSGQAFGIVAVNEGLANTTNPCLAEEISWAQTSTGRARQPKVALYVNTADPGRRATDWPATNYDPITGKHITDPYGSCSGGNTRACAWQYGWDMADLDARARGVSSPGRYLWWLDVETINSWESSAQNNRADLEGMVSYFRHIGAKAGIYSTAKQFGPVVGVVSAGSPLYRLPDWIPGAKTLAQAKKNCKLAPLTRGGAVTVTQWRATVNSDLSCHS